jgi:hypothetical protein
MQADNAVADQNYIHACLVHDARRRVIVSRQANQLFAFFLCLPDRRQINFLRFVGL